MKFHAYSLEPAKLKKDSIADMFHGNFTNFVRDWIFVEHLNTAASNAK